MSLGEAFIDIRARTTGFRAELKALQPELDALQAKTNAALSGLSTQSGAGAGAAPVVAAQESISEASTASADAQIRNLDRVEAARDRALASTRAANDEAVDSTIAAEKAKIAASNSAIAAINQEKAARRAALADAIAAGDETVKALRAEIVEEDKLANAAVAAEKLSIAASRSAIAVINEETLALKRRNEAAGQTGPARTVSPIAALNNAAVKQELADTAAAAKQAEKAIEAARKASEIPFSPGSASGIAEFHALALAAKEAEKAIEEAAKNAPRFSPGSASGIAEFQQISAAAAKARTDQIKYNEEVLASARETAREIAAAETEAYAIVAADARKAAAAQIAAAREAGAAQAASLKGIKSAAGDAFGAITTGAKFAAIGVVGLGAALVGIGISNAAKQQSAIVGFTALAKQIEGSQQALDNFNQSAVDAANGLTKAQSVGKDFENQLIALSNTSILSQAALQNTSQALLALGFTGPQALSTIRDIGNALAASGKDAGQTNEDLKGIVVAFSQIKGAGRLLAQDLNQITTRIPSAGRLQVYKQLAIDLGLAKESTDETSAAFAKTAIQIQKLAKEGKISADIAIPAITRALEQVPGAAKDAATGLDALGRQNLTLSGRFDALKDNIRSALAKAFLQPIGGTGGKTISSQLADQVGAFIPVITAAIAKAGPPLAKFTQQFLGLLGATLPPLVALIAKVFGSLADALDKIDLKKLTDGFNQLSDKGSAAHKAMEDFATVALEAYQVAKLLVPIITAAVKAFALLASILAPLEPAIKGITDVLGKLLSSDIGQGLLAVAGGIAAATLALKAFKTAIIALKGIEELALLARGWKAVAGAEDLATAGAKRYAIASDAAIGGGLLTKIGKARAALALLTSAEVVIPVVAGAVIGAGVATALNAHTPKGFSDADELSVEKFNQGLKDLQARLDSVSDAKAKQQLQDLVKTTLSTNDAQDRFKGALVAAQKVIDNYDAHHIVGANNQLTKSLNDVHFAAVISKEAVANLIRVGTITSSTAGIDNIDTQLRQLVIDGNAAAEAIFRAERQAAGFTINPNVSAADAASVSGEDAALGRAAAAGGPTQPGPAPKAPKAPSAVDLSDAAAAAGSGATKAASTLADKISAAKQTIVDALKAFKTDVTTETPKQIRSALNTIRREFDKLAKLEGVPHIKLDKLIELDSTKLQKFAKQVDALTKAVEAEKSAITSAFSTGQEFTSITTVASDLFEASKSIAGSTADLSRLRIIQPGQDALNTLAKTVAGIKSGLDAVTAGIKDKTAQLSQFAANATKALKAGLNPETEAQLLAAGPTEANLKLAQQLADATPAQIAALNAAQKAADAASAAVAKIAGAVAGPAATIGNQIVDGLIAGLKDKKKLDALQKSMQTLANFLVDALKKALKIKSPSRRMGEEVGAHIVPGLVAGMDHAPLRSAMADVADTLAANAPTLAPINLDALGGLARAEARLQLDAALAPSSVQLLAPPPPDRQPAVLGKDGVAAIVSALANARASKEIHAPVTVHAPAAITDPHATAKMLARAIRSIR